MQSLNIINRANFEDVNLQFSCTIKPGLTGKASSNFLPGQIFCIREISWRYSVDQNASDTYGWPRTPIRITVSDIAKERTESPLKFSPPKILVDSLQIEALNPSDIAVTVHFSAKGVLVTPRNNESLSFIEVLGYVLLDDNQKGMLALSGMHSGKQLEGSDTVLTSLFQHQLPGQQIHALPQNKPAALIDEQSLLSLMIGDLVTYQAENTEFNLKLEQLRLLAKYLIDKKWSR